MHAAGDDDDDDDGGGRRRRHDDAVDSVTTFYENIPTFQSHQMSFS